MNHKLAQELIYYKKTEGTELRTKQLENLFLKDQKSKTWTT